MPHLRKRLLEPLLKKSLHWSPIVGVLGARQSGKTTLLQQLCSEMGTFDDPKLEQAFESAGEHPLESASKPYFLDEVQKYPPIFDLLKLVVDRERRPGQFLITGSVRFSSKSGIRESLTGRAVIWELLPLSLRETNSFEKVKLLDALAKPTLTAILNSLEKHAWCSTAKWERYSELGGMPGICFLRDEVQRNAALKSLLDTVIERDFYFVRKSKIRPYILREILQDLASSQGESVSLNTLARRYRMSGPSIRSILQTFEDLFLIRPHGKTFFIEDLGVSHLLRSESGTRIPRRTLEELVFSELKSIRAYHYGETVLLSSYRTRGGSSVPFVMKSKKIGLIAIAIDEDEYLSEKSLKGLYSYQKTEPTAKLLHVHRGAKATVHKNRVLSIPVGWLF